MTDSEWRIRDEAAAEPRDGALWPPQRFRVFRGNEPTFVARASVLASFVHDAATSLGIDHESDEGRSAVDIALARYAMRRLEDGFASGRSLSD